MIVKNEDVKELVAEIPEGHKHLRVTLILKDGQQMTFQEATVANTVRAYIDIKTHPRTRKVVMRGSALSDRKEGYAEWQLMEED